MKYFSTLFFCFALLTKFAIAGDGCNNGFASTGTTSTNNGALQSEIWVGNDTRILGAPNDSEAEFESDGDEYVMDFNQTYNVGVQYVIRWRKQDAGGDPAVIVLSESADNITFTDVSSFPTTALTGLIDETITSAISFRYLRFRLEDASSNDDFEIDAITVLEPIYETDTDNDGIADVIDIDDDNDGILDVEEYSCGTFTSVGTSSGNPQGITVQTYNFGTYLFASANNGSYTAVISKTMDGLEIGSTFDISVNDVGSTTNINPSETSRLKIEVGNTILYNSTLGSFVSAYSNFGDINFTGTSTGINPIFKITLTKNNNTYNLDPRIGTFNYTICGVLDTDNDGIPNSLDLDSDNDGIPDNIEAQTTSGYTAPATDNAATYATNNGLNSAYVFTGGNTPIDTDADGTPDYLDTDSDNAQTDDTGEAGVSLTNNDADNDGLDDGVDTDNSSFGPVNAGITDVMAAYSNNSVDVDWRIECPNGGINTTQYAIAGVGNANNGWGANNGVIGAPDETGNTRAKRISLRYLNNPVTLTYNDAFSGGAVMTISARHWSGGYEGGFTLAFSGDNSTWTTESSTQNIGSTSYTTLTYTLPAALNGNYKYIRFTATNTPETTLTLIDAVRVDYSYCGMFQSNAYEDSGTGASSGGIYGNCIEDGLENSLNLPAGLYANAVQGGTVIYSAAFDTIGYYQIPSLADGTYDIVMTTDPLGTTAALPNLYSFSSGTGSYSITVLNNNVTSPGVIPVFCIKGCEFGGIINNQYATTSLGGYNIGATAASPNVEDAPDGSGRNLYGGSSGSDISLEYGNSFTAGSVITITAKYNDTRNNGVYVTFSTDGITYTANSPIVNGWSSNSVYEDISYTIPPSLTGNYTYVRVAGQNASSYYNIDAVYVQEAYCNTCPAGLDAPTLSASTATNTCPITTIDLTTITASNDPANTILTWHTGLPATTINRVSDATAVAAGTYYAAFYNLTVDCYASNGDAVTQVIADGDSDCDGVLNGSDLDDDNDGILDTVESNLVSNLSVVAGDGITTENNSFTVTSALTGSWVNSVHSNDLSINANVDFILSIQTAVFSNRYTMIGLNASGTNSTASYTDIDYALYFNANNVRVHENGSAKGSSATVTAATDVFTIVRVGTTISYQKNGIEFYESTVSATASDYYMDTSIHDRGNNGYSFNINFNASSGRDTDNDGSINSLDLDSDSDGIPDNIEAQTTSGYTVPATDNAATYATNNGLNSAYVSTGGNTPIDTDGDGTPDYLDTDSDNAQTDDTGEAGVSLTNIDADNDGLDDGVDTDNSSFGPVNAGITDVMAAYSDNSVDVDWRIECPNGGINTTQYATTSLGGYNIGATAASPRVEGAPDGVGQNIYSGGGSDISLEYDNSFSGDAVVTITAKYNDGRQGYIFFEASTDGTNYVTVSSNLTGFGTTYSSQSFTIATSFTDNYKYLRIRRQTGNTMYMNVDAVKVDYSQCGMFQSNAYEDSGTGASSGGIYGNCIEDGLENSLNLPAGLYANAVQGGTVIYSAAFDAVGAYQIPFLADGTYDIVMTTDPLGTTAALPNLYSFSSGTGSYSITVLNDATTSPGDIPVFCIKGCEFGAVINNQYAIAAAGNSEPSWGSDTGVIGAPDAAGNDNTANRISLSNTNGGPVTLTYNDAFSGGAVMTISARHWDGGWEGGFTLAFSGDNSTWTTESSTQNIGSTSYTTLTYTLPAALNGTYTYIRFTPTGTPERTLTLIDAVYVQEAYCSTCPAGLDAPMLSASTATNTCPTTTIDLTTITASNTPANTILTWHTGLPATTINRVSDAAAVAAGTYYAAFYNLTVDCYASEGEAVTQVIADGDSDCDGVPDPSDIDDDNDGILDTEEGFSIVSLSPQLWLDATDYNGDGTTYSDGTTLTTNWIDKSGNSNDYALVSGPTYQSSEINGKDVVEILSAGFNGPSGAATSTSEWSIIMVTKLLPSDANGRLFDGHVGNNLLGYHGGRKRAVYFNGNPNAYTNTSVNATTSGVTDFEMNCYVRASSGLMNLYSNGNTLNSYANSQTTNGVIWDINQGVYSNESSDSQIGDFIIIPSALSEADRQKVEGYLAHKWGLEASLPASHPYKSSPPSSDLDGDGIPNSLDLDSDNDGIPDNVEAQTTSGYTAPATDNAATYATNNGLNSVYVSTGGNTPIDTDADGTPDYLDTDSDNAQTDDTGEAGVSLTNNDADNDGLDDGVDTDNSSFGPVNAGITDVMAAYSNNSVDVDWRIECPNGGMSKTQYVIAATGASNWGSSNNLLGEPNGTVAGIYQNGTAYRQVLDFGEILPIGTNITFYVQWINGYSKDFTVEYSTDVTNFTYHPSSITINSTSIIAETITSTESFRYIRLNGASSNSHLKFDAVKVDYSQCAMFQSNAYEDSGTGASSGGIYGNCIEDGLENSLNLPAGLYANAVQGGTVIYSAAFDTIGYYQIPSLADGTYDIVMTTDPLGTTAALPNLYSFSSGTGSYSITVLNNNVTSPGVIPVFCIKGCEFGGIINNQYATASTGTGNAGWGPNGGANGAPNDADNSGATSNGIAIGNNVNAPVTLTYDTAFTGGAVITLYARHYNTSYEGDFTIAFSEDNTTWTAPSANQNIGSSTYTTLTYTVPNVLTGSYRYIRLRGTNTPETTITLVDAVYVQEAYCNTCPAGVDAPTLSASTATNTCPITTIDLTTITASNDPANTILTWHTGLPATTINRVSDATAVAAGTYYAAFYNLTVDCYASNGDAVTQVIADGDSDCDGVLNGSDLDDDNDGILDTGENICTTNLYAGNVIEYTDNPIVGDNADDPTSALGASSAPNPPGSSGYVSLGGSAGDYLTLGFTNAYLSNSGDAQNDFRVFEIGSPETMGVRLRPDASTLALLNGSGQSFTIDGQGFYFVGQTQNVIDIDAAFGNAFAMGQLSFDAVKLFAVSNGSGGTAGPDINAIEALYFTCLIDTDNDGIPNSLDLDSDGDGCIDAIEGGSTFTYADLNNNQLAGGVDADGIPIVATASGQTIGSSQDLTVQDVICQCDAVTSGYLDTDSDGVSDICDLDDDNDGILDTEEGTTDLDNDGFPNSLDLDSDGDGCPDAIEGGGTFTITDLNNNQLTGGVDADGIPIVATASSQTIGSSQDLTVQDVICQCDLAFGNLDTDNDGIADVCDLDDDNDGILDTEEGTTDLDNDGFPNSLDLDSDGDGCPDAIEGGGTFTITDLNNNQLTGGVDADGIPIVATASGQTVGSSQDSSIVVCCDAVTSGYLDTDSDGVSDICDLDDDNDGILNTEECNPLINQVYSYTGGDQISIIPIGANLVRAKIWGAGGRGDQRNLRGTGGAGGYTEIEIPISALPGGTTQLIVTVGEGGNSSTGGPTYGNGGAGLIIASGRNCGSGGGMSALGLVSLSNPSSVNVNQIIAIAGGGGTMPAYSSGGSYAGEGGGTKGGDASSYPVNGGQGGSQTSGGLANTNGNIGSFLIGGDAVENGGAGGGGFYGGASGNISGNNEHGGGGGSGYISPSTSNGSTTTGNLQVPPNIADSDYTAGIGVGGNNGGGNGGNGLVILEYELALTCDIDNDGIPNSLDLDSDGDGCPDAIEGGFTDPDSDQILGNSPVVVDLNGLVIGQGGYTSPADLDANSVYDFKEPGAAPTITLQPLSQNVFSGADATFSLTETGADQYQWQESTDGGANYTGIIDGTEYAGALTSSLTILSIPLTKKGFMYRASITRTSFVCDQTLSNEITLTVSPRTVITNRWITNSVKKN